MSERNRFGNQPPLPKPYAFVPLLEGQQDLAKPVGHHRYQPDTLSGVLRATIVARSAVHVASGLLEQTRDPKYPLIKAHFRVNGKIAIPGTSLKGCIRSIVEAISRSAVHVTKARPLPDETLPSRSVDQLDPAARLFGAQGYQGVVRFADAVLIEGKIITVPTPQLFRPRDTYSDEQQPRGRKFYMHGELARGDLPLEACDAGSRFGLRMDFNNLTQGELGLILIALGLGKPRLWPKLGGGKPVCLGTIEVLDPQLTIDDPRASYRDFDAVAALQPLQPLIDAARAERLVLDDQLNRLADILRWPRGERRCPDRSY